MRANLGPINYLGIVYHQYCSFSYLDIWFLRWYWPVIPLLAMEIKFKLDTDKAARATVAIAASYVLGWVSERSEYPQLAFAAALALIVIIAILYGTRPLPLVKKILPLLASNYFLQQPTSDNVPSSQSSGMESMRVVRLCYYLSYLRIYDNTPHNPICNYGLYYPCHRTIAQGLPE